MSVKNKCQTGLVFFFLCFLCLPVICDEVFICVKLGKALLRTLVQALTAVKLQEDGVNTMAAKTIDTVRFSVPVCFGGYAAVGMWHRPLKTCRKAM